eukprot:s677_g16.t1
MQCRFVSEEMSLSTMRCAPCPAKCRNEINPGSFEKVHRNAQTTEPKTRKNDSESTADRRNSCGNMFDLHLATRLYFGTPVKLTGEAYSNELAMRDIMLQT